MNSTEVQALLAKLREVARKLGQVRAIKEKLDYYLEVLERHHELSTPNRR